MRKLLALLLALMIVISAAPLALAEETTVLTVGLAGRDTAFKAIIPGFEAAHPGVMVELVFLSSTDHHQQWRPPSQPVPARPTWSCWSRPGWAASRRRGLRELAGRTYNAGGAEGRLRGVQVEPGLLGGRAADDRPGVGHRPATLFYRRDIFEEVGLPSDHRRGGRAVQDLGRLP
jgi:hypothetical protein